MATHLLHIGRAHQPFLNHFDTLSEVRQLIEVYLPLFLPTVS